MDKKMDSEICSGSFDFDQLFFEQCFGIFSTFF